MKLLIHDLSSEEWEKIREEYEEFTVLSDDGKITPCVGCFGCWLKTPGQCIMKDGYEGMGAMLAHTEQIVIISRYTYGGFSSYVKNVLDRSIGYILPFLRVKKNETHHVMRYPDHTIEMTVCFYGKALSGEEQEQAKKYVNAVCINLGAKLKKVEFSIKDENIERTMAQHDTKGTVLLNCSLRGDNANSKVFLEQVSKRLDEKTEIYNLGSYLKDEDKLTEMLINADKIVFAMPLYVDGLPSSVVRLFEKMNKLDKGGKKKIYVICNMGFYESKQICNLLESVAIWCKETGYEYCGGLAVGAGEMMGPLMRSIPIDKGPVRKVGEELLRMIEKIKAGEHMENVYTRSYMFPRFLYIMAANKGWKRHIVQNGLQKKDLYRKL